MITASFYLVTLDSPEWIQANQNEKQYYKYQNNAYSTVTSSTAITELTKKRNGQVYTEIYEYIDDVSEYLGRPVRQVTGKVELYEGSTLSETYSYDDNLISFSIDRVGDEEKFFGYTIAQRLNVKLIDTQREIEITTANSIKVYMNGIDFAPTFFVTEVHRDENTNQLSITAYDLLYFSSQHTMEEVSLASYTISEFVDEVASVIGAANVDIVDVPVADTVFSTSYTSGANFEPTDDLRYAITSAAEATQTICYLDKDDNLVFKRLDVDGDAVAAITKEDYIKLDSKTNRRLVAITVTNQLGDSVTSSLVLSGSTQIVWDNPFYELRDDIETLLDNAIAYVGGLTIGQFDCDWRGNYLIEIGDKLEITDKEDDTFESFLLNDKIEYNGTLSQDTSWEYKASDSESPTNPSSLGQTLKQTYARVDKVNKEINLLASEVSENSENVASLSLNTESIWAAVQNVQESTSAAVDNLSDDIDELTNTVSAKVTAEDVQIQISTAMAGGVDSVTTSTGFTFNEEGLTISKTGSEMNTSITEDGMTVYRNSSAVLTANNTGVDAVNLHATTYLIIGTNSRFEDYDNGSRTGCFWIGS